MPVVDGGVAKKRIRHGLHFLLALSYALPLVCDRGYAGKVWRVTRRQLLLNLKEKGIVDAVTKKQKNVIARSDASRPNNLKRSIHWFVPLENRLIPCQKSLAVASQRFYDSIKRLLINVSQ